MQINEFLWDIFSIVFVTAVVVIITLLYQKRMKEQ